MIYIYDIYMYHPHPSAAPIYISAIPRRPLPLGSYADILWVYIYICSYIYDHILYIAYMARSGAPPPIYIYRYESTIPCPGRI